MPRSKRPPLEPGRVYRTRDLERWTSNAPRLAKRLVEEGRLTRLAHGLFHRARRTRFGPVPPTDAELMRAFLVGEHFVFTGPPEWNALGLGATAHFPGRLVYNTKRSGHFVFGSRHFWLRRVAFPPRPPIEWFVIDLLQNAARAGVDRREVGAELRRAVAGGRFDAAKLRTMADRFGTAPTRAVIESALEDAAAA